MAFTIDGAEAVSPFAQELRLALRRLRRSPAFALVAVATLVVAIGANTAIFSVVRGVLLGELPFRQPQRLYLLDVEIPPVDELPARSVNLDTLQARYLAEDARSLNGVAVYQRRAYALVGSGEPVRLEAAEVSANLFDVLGTPPQLGRSFSGGGWATDEPEVVLSHGLWRTKLGGDPHILGSRIVLDDRPHTVTGVMSADFAFPHRDVALWTSQVKTPTTPGTVQVSYAPTVVRLSGDATPAQAVAEVDRLLRPEPGSAMEGRPRLVQLQDSLVGAVRMPLLLLAGAAALVLLIAATNLLNLLLVRISTRQRDFAIRRAVGGSRWHLVRQTLSEIAWIAVAGGVFGYLLAAWLLRLLPRWIPGDLPRAEAIRLDAHAFLATLGFSLAVGLACGLVAALRQTGRSATSLADVLRSGTTEPGAARTWRRFLVVAEVALAVVVMIGAGLLARSYLELSRVDWGLSSGPALTATLELGSRYRGPAQQEAFFDDLVERLGRHPEAEAIGVVRFPPLTPQFAKINVSVVNEPPGRSLAIVQATDPGYRAAAGLRLAEGRWLAPLEHSSRAPVAVVNQTFADRFVSRGSALGRQVEMGGETVRIVGVCADVKMLGPTSEPHPEIYVSYRLGATPPTRMTVVLRTGGADPTELAPFLRSTVRELDPDLPLEAVGTLGARLASATARPRFYAMLLTAFAAVATLLAAAGVYALLAQFVTDQTRHLGIRRALGAQSADVVSLVLREGFVLIGIGLAGGLAAAAASARLVSSLLYELSAHHLPTYLGVSLAILLIGAAACLLPLRRAMRIDPLEALRES